MSEFPVVMEDKTISSNVNLVSAARIAARPEMEGNMPLDCYVVNAV
ncbi:MAG: hypothetical protein VX079_09225 [Pseudomonadota bacterium]|nr:hypothetical protein [Pseudomonadota bacterium]MEC8164732.1 hypothetical protein [Pseudomonadota bacterium]MEC8203767.1 hypothetical protein [Pseudomonadota bacterium]